MRRLGLLITGCYKCNKDGAGSSRRSLGLRTCSRTCGSINVAINHYQIPPILPRAGNRAHQDSVHARWQQVTAKLALLRSNPSRFVAQHGREYGVQ